MISISNISNRIYIKGLIAFVCISFSFNTYAQQDVFDICRKGTVEELTKLYNTDQTIISKKNEKGYSPLDLASYSGNDEIVSFLVDKLDTINDTNDRGSALMGAVFKGYIKIVDILIKHDANVNLQDEQGATAAHYATMLKKYSIIELLIEAKADFNIENNNKQTALDIAIMLKDKKIDKLLNL